MIAVPNENFGAVGIIEIEVGLNLARAKSSAE